MKPWTRDQTKDWIIQLENRIDDIVYYLNQTTEWCEKNNIIEVRRILVCCIITCLWVVSMRNETISYTELLDILGLDGLEDFEDKIYDLGTALEGKDLEEILQIVSNYKIEF